MLAKVQDKSPKQPKKIGRPVGTTKLQPTDETIKQIEGLARIQCTVKEAGAVLGVSEPTFYAFLNAHKKAKEAWENGKESGKASLRRNQYKMSENNATMAIWLGKQMLGQKDNIVVGGDDDAPLRVHNCIEFVIVTPQKAS